MSKTDRILQRHRRALRDVLHHRVSSVSKQRRRPQTPVIDWFAVHDNKAAEAFGDTKDAPWNIVGIREIRQYGFRYEILWLAERVLTIEHRAAKVEHAPVANRVIDYVPAWPGPECRIGSLQSPWHRGRWNGGAENDCTDRQRVTIVDYAATYV